LADTFQAVIFDMDGTLIEQMLDFDAIRAELGVSPRDGIPEAIPRMPPEAARRAGAKLPARETSAAEQAALLPDARECDFADQADRVIRRLGDLPEILGI
jgi:beta-phosphoglucomutase-like phosphatase (HAD superfamily)